MRKLKVLPRISIIHALTILLKRMGFGAIEPVARSGKDEFHLSAVDERYGASFRTAVVLRRDPPEFKLSEREVVDLRGALHHYHATRGIIITTANIGETARSEAETHAATPIRRSPTRRVAAPGAL